jgi:hypothetical protein
MQIIWSVSTLNMSSNLPASSIQIFFFILSFLYLCLSFLYLCLSCIPFTCCCSFSFSILIIIIIIPMISNFSHFHTTSLWLQSFSLDFIPSFLLSSVLSPQFCIHKRCLNSAATVRSRMIFDLLVGYTETGFLKDSPFPPVFTSSRLPLLRSPS